MYAAEEDTAHQNPEHYRHPAEQSGVNRACDGAGSGDGRKMMSHKYRGLGRNIVDAVRHGMCRCLLFGFTHAPLFAEPSSVEDITTYQNGNRNDNQY